MKQKELYNEISKKLASFEQKIPLSGLSSPAHRESFILQIRDSVRRVKYIDALEQRPLHPVFADPQSPYFNPLKAAIIHKKAGNINESFWLVFLFVHFGKHLSSGYNLVRAFYGKLGINPYWTWDNLRQDITGFRQWLHTNSSQLRQQGAFGNHRKYQSLRDDARYGTGATIESYCNLIGPDHSHFIDNINDDIRSNPDIFFDYLFRLFTSRIVGFNRLSSFDLVTMLGKVGLVNAEPSSPYLRNATGPKEGTKLLFDAQNASTMDLNECLRELGAHLNFPYSMQVVEDAVCNWQKSPTNYIQFKG